MLAASILGARVVMLSPDDKKYRPKKKYLELAKRLGGEVKLTSDVEIGVAGADVIYNDIWVSMGMEGETEQRISDFRGLQVDSEMVKLAAGTGGTSAVLTLNVPDKAPILAVYSPEASGVTLKLIV